MCLNLVIVKIILLLIQLTKMQSRTMKKIERVKWTDLKGIRGNKFAIAPNSRMLREGGKPIERNFSLTKGGDKHTVIAVYDEEYVIAWLRHSLIGNLIDVPFQDLQKLIAKAYKQEKAAIAERLGQAEERRQELIKLGIVDDE